MEKYQGVAITDGVNRKNHILPLNAIIKAYRDTWNTVIPMNLDIKCTCGTCKSSSYYTELFASW